MRVWVNRTAAGVFLNGQREGAPDIGPIVSTCSQRATPPRLNGVRVVHTENRAVGIRQRPGSWHERWAFDWSEPIRVRTCRGRRR